LKLVLLAAVLTIYPSVTAQGVGKLAAQLRSEPLSGSYLLWDLCEPPEASISMPSSPYQLLNGDMLRITTRGWVARKENW